MTRPLGDLARRRRIWRDAGRRKLAASTTVGSMERHLRVQVGTRGLTVMRGMILAAVMVTVASAYSGPSPRAPWREPTTPPTTGNGVPRIPRRFRGFEAFEPAIRARRAGRDPSIEEDVVDCDKVIEPSVPARIPSWADASVDELRVRGFRELVNSTTLVHTQAFEHGDEIVIKKCSRAALRAVVAAARPYGNPANGPADLTRDIFFDCGDETATCTVYLKDTIELGSRSRGTRGTYRLLALDRNVVLDGGGKVRIMRVLRGANVLVYGVTFRRGRTGNAYGLSLDGMPPSGYGGAGILVSVDSAVTAYHCRFLRNRVEALYARWGGGAALKLEQGAYGLVWGCLFDGNDAAVGGAIATSSAFVLQVAYSTFIRNVARGGMDDNGQSRPDDKTKNPLKEKRVILVRGGSLRVDSGFGADVHDGEHVLICGSKFTGNRLEFSTSDLVNKFGYEPDDWFYVRGAGAAATLWNAPFTMDEVTDNRHFASVKDCVFTDNYDAIEPEGDYLGRYVLEFMGAGNFRIEECEFRRNRVNNAVLKVDNSQRWQNPVVEYEGIFKDLRFLKNGAAYNIEIQPGEFTSSCTFSGVDGVPDGGGNCREQLEDAADRGGNVSIVEGDDFDCIEYTPAATTVPPTPVQTVAPTRHPEFAACTNEFGLNRCLAIKDRGKCGDADEAKSCRMTCASCEVCVDFNAQVCADALRFRRCENPRYMERCAFTCNLCESKTIAPLPPSASATPVA